MIGYNLITHQTTKAGLKVSAVLIHEGVDIQRQIYLAFILDRNSQRPALVISKKGGKLDLNIKVCKLRKSQNKIHKQLKFSH
jgi:succinyl-CoA synthetase beta subunit